MTTAIRGDVLSPLLSEHVPSDISSPDLALAFRPDPAAWDGRYSLDPWLQELPRPITRLMWGNAAFVAPETARARGLQHGGGVRLRVGDRSVDATVYVLAGHPPDQITVHLGYGRRALRRASASTPIACAAPAPRGPSQSSPSRSPVPTR
ncbi:hypothetical protein [Nannocystis pusilla]|uniref:hypothetical protein n=1 Tax=Nannocystis pusilla TaxID=889268 RepID=UPI003B7DA8DA